MKILTECVPKAESVALLPFDSPTAKWQKQCANAEPTNFIISLSLPHTNCFINRNTNSIFKFIILNFSLVSWILAAAAAQTGDTAVPQNYYTGRFVPLCWRLGELWTQPLFQVHVVVQHFGFFVIFRILKIYCIVATRPRSTGGKKTLPFFSLRFSGAQKVAHTGKCREAATNRNLYCNLK